MLKPEKRNVHMSKRSFPKRPKKRQTLDEDPAVGEKKLAFFVCTRFFASIAFQNQHLSRKRHFSFKVKGKNVKLKGLFAKIVMLSTLNPKMCTSQHLKEKKISFQA